MRIKVKGFRDVHFTTESGDEISGKTVYYCFGENNVTGLACDKIFISAAKLDGVVVSPDTEVELVFNRFGKVDKVLNIK